jgi:hypothetical protein
MADAKLPSLANQKKTGPDLQAIRFLLNGLMAWAAGPQTSSTTAATRWRGCFRRRRRAFAQPTVQADMKAGFEGATNVPQ